MMDIQFHDYTKRHCIVPFKWVNCMVYEFYLNKAVYEKKRNRKKEILNE